jgi:hypothetical protein
MKTGKRMTCLMTALALVVLSLSPSSIPPEISEFYEDYNFVASFSTPGERDTMIDYFSEDVLPKDIRNDRRNRVFRLMKKLYSRVTSIDPKMVQRLGPKMPNIKYFFHSELLDVKNIDTSGKKAVVEIWAYTVEPEFVNRYILEYETNQNDEDGVPSNQERIESIKSRIRPRTEFHIWLYQNGQWMKAEHKNIYIKN